MREFNFIIVLGNGKQTAYSTTAPTYIDAYLQTVRLYATVEGDMVIPFDSTLLMAFEKNGVVVTFANADMAAATEKIAQAVRQNEKFRLLMGSSFFGGCALQGVSEDKVREWYRNVKVILNRNK